ncbi:MAG: hypothetical protein KAQ88_11675, partial [Hyphomicrobiaceae bacterium]|nr:hypothetical protein [Hyphomicrobiaceae bacterium]
MPNKNGQMCAAQSPFYFGPVKNDRFDGLTDPPPSVHTSALFGQGMGLLFRLFRRSIRDGRAQ